MTKKDIEKLCNECFKTNYCSDCPYDGFGTGCVRKTIDDEDDECTPHSYVNGSHDIKDWKRHRAKYKLKKL